MKRIDAHVHLVGDGSSGSGCWLDRSPLRFPLMALMLHHLGVPVSALIRDLDRLYLSRLLTLTEHCSLDAFVLLAQEQVYDDHGRLAKGWGTAYVPNDYVFSVAKQYPRFLPAVSIHPARPDALDELDRCLDAGAVMMKCLPMCQNIDTTDRRFKRFWERMAEARLPLLAHTGGEHTLQVVRPEFADPARLEFPLQCGVTVIAAHAAAKSGLIDTQFFPRLVSMMERHPNLYADNSAFNANFRGQVTPQCLQSPVIDRIVHGSDFPVPIYPVFPWVQGQIDWADYQRAARIPNSIERDYQLKRAMGFREETFTRIGKLLRLPQAI